MNIKNIALAAILAAVLGIVGFGFWNKYLSAKETNVSGIVNKPAEYLGNVVVTGLAGIAYPEKGAFELKDDKGCCAVFVLVPTSEGQKKEFDLPYLYKGKFPGSGQLVRVSAKLVERPQGYALEVKSVESGGEEIITRI